MTISTVLDRTTYVGLWIDIHRRLLVVQATPFAPGEYVRLLCLIRLGLIGFVLTVSEAAASTETLEEWITLGPRVHGAFSAFIPAWDQDRT
jgi:hypothetical protein